VRVYLGGEGGGECGEDEGRGVGGWGSAAHCNVGHVTRLTVCECGAVLEQAGARDVAGGGAQATCVERQPQ